MWWDNWSGRGAMAQILSLEGKNQSKERVKDFVTEGSLDLGRLGS